jgi:anaerobic magnesium-protoporphyrin IX monomethyl ester cyclase
MTTPQETLIALVSTTDALTQSPPLGLMCLAAALGKAGFSAEIFDLAIHPAKEAELVAAATAGRYAWIGFSAMTPSVPAVARVMERLVAEAPGVPLVLGGIHGSSLPERSLREMPLAAVCVGDGEDAAVALTQRLAAGAGDLWEIPGVAALDEAGGYRFDVAAAKAREPKPPPRPAWELIDLADYQRCPPQYIKRRPVVAPIVVSKGCPQQCSFCAVPAYSQRRLVCREPKDVVDEIVYLAKERGVGEIHILDDNFNLNLEYAKRVLREWAARDPGVVWKTPIGFWIHAFDEEWFELLKATGCYQVGFGLESGSPEVLARVGKKIRLGEVGEVLAKYRRHGISTFGYFILGLPGDKPATISQTIAFADALPLDHIHVSLFTPYPGSAIYTAAAAAGRTLPAWADYHHFHHRDEFVFCDMTIDALQAALRRFYRRFYSRPGRAWNLLGDLRRSGVRPFAAIARRIFFDG